MASSDSNMNNGIRPRLKQNFLLVWVDATVNSATIETKEKLEKLRAVIADVRLVDHPNKAIDLLKSVETEISFVITSGFLGLELVPRIHPIPSLHAVYILCQNIKSHSTWPKNWYKIVDVTNRIDFICNALQQKVRQYNQDHIAMTFIENSDGDGNHLNRLQLSFMYTALLKDALINMGHDRSQEIQQFYNNALHKYPLHKINRSVLDQFRKNYQSDKAIQWFCKQSCIFSLMNDALRYLEGDVIVDMGFFIYDLHQQLAKLHKKQSEKLISKKFVVYRGQALSETALKQMQQKKGALFSFNNFLLASRKKEKSMTFAASGTSKEGYVGALFKMTIDSRIRKVLFADISHIADFPDEVLCSMHTVFRIDDVQPLAGYKRLYEIELQLIGEEDPEFKRLTEHYMGENIKAGWDWLRVGLILRRINQLEKAEEVYLSLLRESPNTWEKGACNHQLGLIHYNQGKYEKALEYYQKSLQFNKQIYREDDPILAMTYNNIGSVHDRIRKYAEALVFYEKSLNIEKKTLSDSHPDLAGCYNNIGLVYTKLGQYEKALPYFENTLAIQTKILPGTHSHLATSYNNIGLLYRNMGDCRKALSYYEKSLAIDRQTLPDTHPYLATSYHNIGIAYDTMEEYSKALSYYEISLDIDEKTLPDKHPSLGTSYNCIGTTYYKMKNFVKALDYFERALQILLVVFSAHHPDIASLRQWISSTKREMNK